MQLPDKQPALMTGDEWKKAQLADKVAKGFVKGFASGFRQALEEINGKLPDIVKEAREELRSQPDLGFDVDAVSYDEWVHAAKYVLKNIGLAVEIDNNWDFPTDEQALSVPNVIKAPASDERPEIEIVTPFGSIYAKW